MKTIIEWFWNLDAVINITTAEFWWIVGVFAIPTVLMLWYSFNEKHRMFWMIASSVYTVFALSWTLNFGWNLRENKLQKTKTINVTQTVTVEPCVVEIQADEETDSSSNSETVIIDEEPY